MRKEWLNKLLNIRTEEQKPVFLMMCFSFFIGLSLTFYFTASNAIFLKHFHPSMIPVSFIASGILVYLSWLSFAWIDKRSPLARQVTLKFLFVFISVLAISTGVWISDAGWLIFIMYTWVRVMVYITLVNFWGVAGRLFNIRQGKRIFGLISVGEVVSIIIGYFSIPLILKIVKAPDLLFLASASLLVCLILVMLIFRAFPVQLSSSVNNSQMKPAASSEWTYRKLVRKPYFMMISLMALLPIFGYLFVDFLFLAQTKAEFALHPENIAGFLGIFLGSVAVLELLLKLLSGRFLNRYGLRPSMLSLPLILLVSIFLAAVFGTLYGTVGLFFAFISLARLFERSIRGAVYEPAFQLLYQPVPAEQRLPFQNQIEGIPKASGTVLTGSVIILFGAIPGFGLIHFNWLFLLILAGWIWAAFRMYEEYRNMLKAKLTEMKATATAAPAFIPKDITPLREFPFEHLKELVRSNVTSERLMAARMLGDSGRYHTFRLLATLMKDTEHDVRKAAIISSGKVRRPELWPFLLENLVNPEYSHTAAEALKTTGEPVLRQLDRFFEKTGTPKQVQIKILEVMEAISGVEAIRLLRNRMHHPDGEVRFRALLSLSNLEYRAVASETSFIGETIEETVNHLTWVLASLHDLSATQGTEELKQALLQELEEKKEQVFLLLSLLYDAKTITHIRENIESKDTNARIYALEISDMTVSADIRDFFFPIFDDLAIHDRLQKLSHRFPQEKMEPFDRVCDIINQEQARVNHWTRSCAINALQVTGAHDPDMTASLLAANLVHPDRLIGEVAAWNLFNMFQDYYFDTLVRFDKHGTLRLEPVTAKIKRRAAGSDLLIFEKIVLLKAGELFAPVPETKLVPLVLDSENHTGNDNRPLAIKADMLGRITLRHATGYLLSVDLEKMEELMSQDLQFQVRLRSYLNDNEDAKATRHE